MNHLFNYLLRLGDSSLILGHRISETCSNGPFLEEDIAQTNIALDHLGQAQSILDFAGSIEGKGRSADDLAYLRPEREFKTLLLVQQPNTDFAAITVRNLLFDAWQLHLYTALLKSPNETLSGLAAKGLKETKYHLRHSTEWCVRLGDGTEESNSKAQNALDKLWAYTGELFEETDEDRQLAAEDIAVGFASLQSDWTNTVTEILERATLKIPNGIFMQTGSRKGIHSEYLGFMLAEMQYLPRAYPDAKW